MTHPELSDEQLAALLEGRPAGIDGHPVADALRRAREQLAAEPVPTPGAALSEFLGVGRVTEPIPRSTQAADFVDVMDEVDPTPRRIPVLTFISAFIGTVSGKVLVGTTVAAASIGGAHAAGVVDVPLLPDIDDAAVVETIDDPDETDDLDELDELDELETDDTGAVDSDDSRDDSDLDDSDSDSDDSDEDSDSDSDDSDSDSDDSDSDSDDSDDSDDDSDDSDDDSDDSDDSDSDDDSDDSDDDSDDDTTATTTLPANNSTFTQAYTVPGVGTTTVQVTNGQITLVSAVPSGSWVLDEAGPDEDGVESEYVNGDLEVRIDFEIEDGQLRVRVREENDATDERSERFEYFPLS